MLKYWLVNEAGFLKGAHNRIYPYSSGTIFARICTPLEAWSTAIEAGEDTSEDEQNASGDGEAGAEEEEVEESQRPAYSREMTPEDMLRKVSYTHCAYT